jgi:hypothetical protein
MIILYTFDGGICRVGFFWDRLNAHQCSYVTQADRRVEGLVAEGWVDRWGVRYGWAEEWVDRWAEGWI